MHCSSSVFIPKPSSRYKTILTEFSLQRLILDLSILNLSIKKEKVKFEDWKIAVQYFERDAFMFKFDLKSDYFHLDIFPQQYIQILDYNLWPVAAKHFPQNPWIFQDDNFLSNI
jgi:hypothetical protein